MASESEEPSSPALANLTVVVGFIVIFSTFLTDSAWSWVIGGTVLLGGALWAGLADTGEPAVVSDTATTTSVNGESDDGRTA